LSLSYKTDDFTALLKAIAQKLIPGIPIQTRISNLQQTSDESPASEIDEVTASMKELMVSNNQLSVLEAVIDRATSRNEIQYEIDSKILWIFSRGLY